MRICRRIQILGVRDINSLPDPGALVPRIRDQGSVCCSVLQCVAALQCVAVCCSVL